MSSFFSQGKNFLFVFGGKNSSAVLGDSYFLSQDQQHWTEVCFFSNTQKYLNKMYLFVYIDTRIYTHMYIYTRILQDKDHFTQNVITVNNRKRARLKPQDYLRLISTMSYFLAIIQHLTRHTNLAYQRDFWYSSVKQLKDNFGKGRPLQNMQLQFCKSTVCFVHVQSDFFTTTGTSQCNTSYWYLMHSETDSAGVALTKFLLK